MFEELGFPQTQTLQTLRSARVLFKPLLLQPLQSIEISIFHGENTQNQCFAMKSY